MNNAWLPLTTVQVARETAPTNDGMGGLTTATTILTTLSRCAIYQASSSDRFLSDKVAKGSTHVLVCDGDTYSWNNYDKHVVYGTTTFDITGSPDNVTNLGRMTVVGLDVNR